VPNIPSGASSQPQSFQRLACYDRVPAYVQLTRRPVPASQCGSRAASADPLRGVRGDRLDWVPALRLAEVAKQAGVSSGTVHYYFETKKDVLTAAFEFNPTDSLA
jgi:hypothetical protein